LLFLSRGKQTFVLMLGCRMPDGQDKGQ